MLLPQVQPTATVRQTTERFCGYHHAASLCVEDGYFYDMENMSGREYPVLCTRPRRTTEASITAPQGLIAVDGLLYIDGTAVVYGGARYDMGLTSGSKQLVSMGAYVLIFPDKKYFNTKNTADRGDIGMRRSVQGRAVFTLCDEQGTAYIGVSASPTAPRDPTADALWLDSSGTPHVLRKWDNALAQWVALPSSYIKLSLDGIGQGVRVYDGITLSGIVGSGADPAVKEQLEGLNGVHCVHAVGAHYLVLSGVLDQSCTLANASLTVAREVPDMDYVTEADNRIWGCRYGIQHGVAVNEIYACKLGDFRNWNSFLGISSDSYVAQRGTGGAFTGAATYLGNPLFFREGCIETVYVSSTGAHQIISSQVPGVKDGSWRSICTVNGLLLYHGVMGVYAYSGAIPTLVSEALGERAFTDARAGALAERYYLCVREGSARHLFVYEARKKLWYREDDLAVQMFAFSGGALYAIDEENGVLLCLTGGAGTPEDTLPWRLETGALGFRSLRGVQRPEREYLSRFVLRAELTGLAVCSVRYDGGDWRQKAVLCGGGGIRAYTIPVMPTHCDHLQLRIEGEGAARIYALQHITEPAGG